MAVKAKRDSGGRVVGFRIDYRVTVDGVVFRKRATFLGVNKSTAEKILAKRLADAAEGRVFRRNEVKNPPVGHLIDEYLDATEEKKSHRRDLTSAVHLRQHLAKTRFREVVPDTVRKYRQARVRESRTRTWSPAAATLNREVALLKRVMSWAFENQLVDELRLRAVKMLPGERIRDRVLTQAEFDALIANCEPYLANICICAWDTGMRKGEILSLCWRNVDLAKRLLRIEAAVTKTKKARLVPITDALLTVLNSMPRGLPDVHVFRYRKKPIERIDKSFKEAKAAAGLEDFRFHDFRHCFVTRMRRLGVAKEVVMAVTGHATDVMFRRYRTVEETDLNQILEVTREQHSAQPDAATDAAE